MISIAGHVAGACRRHVAYEQQRLGATTDAADHQPRDL
jgi:hypothetical protein